MNLGVIVLNYNSYEDTIKYVKCIGKFKCIDKIIVVDNCSTNDSYEKMLSLKSNKVDVIKSKKNGGYSYGNNYGIKYLLKKYGKCKYICISNSDIVIEEKAFTRCLSYLDTNDNVAAVAPKMYTIDNVPHMLSGWMLRNVTGDVKDSSLLLTKYNKFPHCERYDVNWMAQKEIVVDCLAGSFFIIKQKVFEEIGYFDENLFLYFEEDVIGNKIKKHGYINVILNDVKFTHMESVTIDKSFSQMKKFRQMQKSKRYYHKTYNNAGFIKLAAIDFFTYFRYVEVFFQTIKHKLYKYAIIRYMVKNIKWCLMLFKYILKWFIKSLIGLIKIILWILCYLFTPISCFLSLFNKKKVLYNSVVTWKWIKQRPHYVAEYLANNGFKVTYGSQNLYKKFRNDNLSHSENKVNNKNLKIKDFNILPDVGVYSKINSLIRFVRYNLFNYRKIIFTHPNQLGDTLYKILKYRNVDVYYECMDNYIGWEDNKELYEKLEKRLVNFSCHIFVSSLGLKNQLIKKYGVNEDKISIVRNGYDEKLFKNLLKGKSDLHKKCVTYIGTIDEWFDFDNVCKYAKKHPDVNFEIIGPIGNSIKNKISTIKENNIYFHKPIEHDLVPQYIKDSDVLIVPFKLNDIIEYVDPVKVYEYLYYKKNVVTSYWKELDQFKDMVYFYNNYDEFEKSIDLALKNKFVESNNYRKLMNESKWSNRLIEYKNVLSNKKIINKTNCKFYLIMFFLILFFIINVLFLYKKSIVSNIVNPNITYSFSEADKIMFSMNLDISKYEMKDENNSIAVFIDESSGLNVGLMYYYSYYSLYPFGKFNVYPTMKDGYNDDNIDIFKNDLSENNINYVMCFSSCNWLSNYYDIEINEGPYAFLLLKNDSGNLTEIYNEKFDPIRYKEIFSKYGKDDVFKEYLLYFKNNYEVYGDSYSKYVYETIIDKYEEMR